MCTAHAQLNKLMIFLQHLFKGFDQWLEALSV